MTALKRLRTPQLRGPHFPMTPFSGHRFRRERDLASRQRCLICVVGTMSIIGSAVKRYLVVAIIAVAGGFLGSVLHDLSTAKPTTVRAERFEVVERSGRVLSYWGPDADRNIPPATPRGTLLVFFDSHAVRRLQLGAVTGNYSPHLRFYDKDGPPDTPLRYDAQPRLNVGLGWTGSPVLRMRGGHGDSVVLGAMYGDVYGERELGWGLSFRAWEPSATADIGYTRWWDGTYRSSVTLNNGAGKHWGSFVGDLKPMPIVKKKEH